MPAKVEAILAIGGNLGNRRQNIIDAAARLQVTAGIELIAISPLVESAAMTPDGLDDTKPRYLNGVIQIETTLKPKALLEVIRKVEAAGGRLRLERWGSRTIDIDIITFGRQLIDTRSLTIPHPRAHERAFVLVPWAALNPDAVLPGFGRVFDLAESMQNQVWLPLNKDS
jgi:2-amino-4-hydroxy-6-hydroxymethyldihydropteridine diphosphokinase